MLMSLRRNLPAQVIDVWRIPPPGQMRWKLRKTKSNAINEHHTISVRARKPRSSHAAHAKKPTQTVLWFFMLFVSLLFCFLVYAFLSFVGVYAAGKKHFLSDVPNEQWKSFRFVWKSAHKKAHLKWQTFHCRTKSVKHWKRMNAGKSQVNAFNVQHSGAIWDELKQTLELSLRCC